MFIQRQFFTPDEQKPAAAPSPETGAPMASTAGTANVQPIAGTPASGSTASDNTPVKKYDSIKIKTESYAAEFSTRGAALKSYTLNDFYNLPKDSKSKERIPLPVIAQIDNGALSLALLTLNINGKIEYLGLTDWKLVQIPEAAEAIDGVTRGGKELKFQTAIGNLKIERVYQFDKDYGFKTRLDFINTSATPVPVSYNIAGPAGIIPDDLDNSRFGMLTGISGSLKDNGEIDITTTGLSKLEKESTFTHDTPNPVWAGLHNRFFTSILVASRPEFSEKVTYSKLAAEPGFAENFGEGSPWVASVLHAHKDQARVSIAGKVFVIPASSKISHDYEFYTGPFADKYTEAFNPMLKNIVPYSFSWLGPISRLLLKILSYIVSIVQNYGIAIIILTFVVKLCLHPLTRKTITSQKKMQKIQPLLKQVKEKYKDDKQKQQMETMKLFQENGVSPVGGCLPMLIQLPIFFALYGAFSRSFSMRQEAFIPGWIDDLSSPDSLFNLGFSVPYFEWTTFNLLPIIYVLLQFIQMTQMPKSDDPQMQSQQKMMRMMPLVMAFIFYNMPSGLVLYFVTNVILTIIEHKMLKRDDSLVGGDEATAAAAAPSAVPAGTGITSQGKKNKKKKK